jgi:PIN domain nuclease of toxin-antitoxin system
VIGVLDTHTLIWAAKDPSRLSAPAATFIRDPANTIYLSVVSVWEIVIKAQTRKAATVQPIRTLLAMLPGVGFTLLDVRVAHALAVEGLPPVHKDPFDRLLAAQAIAEGAVLITIDPVFAHYPVTVVW